MQEEDIQQQVLAIRQAQMHEENIQQQVLASQRAHLPERNDKLNEIQRTLEKVVGYADTIINSPRVDPVPILISYLTAIKEITGYSKFPYDNVVRFLNNTVQLPISFMEFGKVKTVMDFIRKDNFPSALGTVTDLIKKTNKTWPPGDDEVSEAPDYAMSKALIFTSQRCLKLHAREVFVPVCLKLLAEDKVPDECILCLNSAMFSKLIRSVPNKRLLGLVHKRYQRETDAVENRLRSRLLNLVDFQSLSPQQLENSVEAAKNDHDKNKVMVVWVLGFTHSTSSTIK
jgi:hypothetical protein